MATTPAGARLTQTHRAAQLAVRARSLQGLVALWRAVDPADLKNTIGVFTEAATLLAANGFEDSATVAARYITQFRAAEGASGTLALPRAQRPDRIAIAADLRGAALKGIIDGRRAGLSTPGAARAGLARVTGALAKQVLTGGWMTILNAVQQDPEVTGWTRVTSGDPCAFCRMLASRGQVYKSEKSADFEAHGSCACTPEPVYSGPQLADAPTRQARVFRVEYATAQTWAKESGTLSSGTSNDALNNYRRWLANGGPEPGEKVTGAPGE